MNDDEHMINALERLDKEYGIDPAFIEQLRQKLVEEFEGFFMDEHTMQAAMALSPTNKACTTPADGGVFAIQEHEDCYRIWVVSSGETAVWAGKLREHEIDALQERFGVNPGACRWEAMGIAQDTSQDYQVMETALKLLATQVTYLQTELLVIKGLLIKEEELHHTG